MRLLPPVAAAIWIEWKSVPAMEPGVVFIVRRSVPAIEPLDEPPVSTARKSVPAMEPVVVLTLEIGARDGALGGTVSLEGTEVGACDGTAGSLHGAKVGAGDRTGCRLNGTEVRSRNAAGRGFDRTQIRACDRIYGGAKGVSEFGQRRLRTVHVTRAYCVSDGVESGLESCRLVEGLDARSIGISGGLQQFRQSASGPPKLSRLNLAGKI